MAIPVMSRAYVPPYGESDYMRPYGAVLSISDSSRPTYTRVYDDRVEVDLQFHNHDTYMQFKRDLLGVRDMSAEHKLREKYPAVKQAWDEYQLLLKLTR